MLVKFFGERKSFVPKKIINRRDFIKINNTYNRIVYAHGYPRSVEAGFLDKIVSSSGDFDLSIHINPYPIEKTMVGLNKELQKQRADLYKEETKGMINPSLEIKYQDTKKILEDLQKGTDKLFNISLYINCRAKNREELDLLTKRVEAELNSLLIIPKIPSFRMAQGMKSIAPLGIDLLKETRNITTMSLSAFFPFTSQFLKVDDTGVWLGLNKNSVPIIRDIFRLSNPNGIILAQSGGGKSYFSKLLIARYLLNSVKVIVIDPQGEYRDLVKHFNGQRVNLSRTSETMINPLDLIGHDYAEKRLSLMDLMPVILGELTEPQKSFIDRALTKAYEKRGINEDKSTWDNEPPILEDVLNSLQSFEKGAITLEKTTIRSLINRLSMYVDGVFSFMNRITNIDFNNNFVCFDIGELPKQVKPVMMFLVLDYVYMKMRQSLDRKLLVIDESWSLLSRAEDSSYIFEIVKTCRKFNMGLLLINQEVEGLLNSEAGKSVLANSSYTLLMRQKPAVIGQVQETFHLSSAERTYLLTASVGEGILLIDDDHTEIKVVASEEEHRIITTNPDERIEIQKSMEVKMEQKQTTETIKEENNKINEQPMQVSEQALEIKPKEMAGKNLEQPKEKIEAILKETPKIEAVNPKEKSEVKSIEDSKTEIAAEPKKQYTKRVDVKIFEDKRCYRKKDWPQEQIEYWLKNGYYKSKQWDIETGKTEVYLLKPRFNESGSHLFLVCRIAEYLRRFTNRVWLFETNQPDIIFETKDGKKVAVEVETGAMLKYKPKELKKRVKLLDDTFDRENWFFVVTNKEAFWEYQKLGQCYTRKDVIKKIQEYLQKEQVIEIKNRS